MIWVLACAPEAPVVAPAEVAPAVVATGPDIVLVTIESLRADHVQFQGYGRETMPETEALGGRVFTRAYAPSSWTLPSMASILTGLTPGEHGIKTADYVLAEGADTVAEDLSAAGYETAFFGVNQFFVEGRGLHQGFEMWQPSSGTSARQLVGQVETFVRQRRDARPLFLVVHVFEPHCPYKAPRDFEGRYTSAPGARITDEQWARMGDCFRADRDLGATIDRYDEEILAADEAVGRVARLFPEAVVIVTGDHGESFWEDDDFGHGRSVVDEQIHVPLVVRGLPAGVEDRPVSGAWIAGTVRDLAGLPHGATLSEPAEMVVSETAYEVARAVVISEGGRLYVDERGETAVGTPHPDAAMALIDLPGTRRGLDPTTERELRRLGYAE